jgi:hypothetical protein
VVPRSIETRNKIPDCVAPQWNETKKEGDGFARLRLGGARERDAVGGACVTIEIGADFPIGIMDDPAALDTAENRAAWMNGTVEDSATESLLSARHAYQVPETGLRLEPGQKLGESYQAASLPVLHRRLSQASLRPAMELNEEFDGK